MECEICYQASEEFWQPFGPDKKTILSFACPGKHARGFPIIKVCSDCRDAIKSGTPRLFKYRGKQFKVEKGQVIDLGLVPKKENAGWFEKILALI